MAGLAEVYEVDSLVQNIADIDNTFVNSRMQRDKFVRIWRALIGL